MFKNPLYQYGPGNVVVPAHINLGQFLLEKISSSLEKDAIINSATDHRLKYKDIAQQGINLAVSLYKLGVRKGQVVAFCSENRSECCPTILGALCTGATITAINLQYTKGELQHVLGISKPSFIFCSPYTFKMHAKTFLALKHVKKIIVYGADVTPQKNVILYEDLIRNNVNVNEFQVVEVNGQNDVAVILYSSGTTGLPKGVMLTHLNVIATCSQPSIAVVVEDHKTLSVAPWFHAMGLIGLLISMSNCRCNVYISKFEVDFYLKTIEKYKITHCPVVPPVLVAITKSPIRYDVSSVVGIYCGAAPLTQETIEAAQRIFPNVHSISQAYGLTETTLAVTSQSQSVEKSMKGTVGLVTPGTTIKIVDPETRKPLGPNQRGEICVKSVTVMKGYIGKDSKDDFDDEGFFKTGDIGYYDEDGYFYIVDRLKELIKYKGFQVAPAEIESVLLSHPGVRDAGVVGAPHAAGGEAPRAFVARQPGAAVTEDELKAYVAERLSNPKHLRGGVRFISEIPKNPSGKILRKELRKMSQKSKL